MEQVSGRAGRKPLSLDNDHAGKVMIQTSNPAHPVLKYVSEHDYKKMFADELEKRKQFYYPPYSRIIYLKFKHKIKEVVERAAHQYANALKNKYEKFLVGPAEPVINRVRNQVLLTLSNHLSVSR